MNNEEKCILLPANKIWKNLILTTFLTIIISIILFIKESTSFVYQCLFINSCFPDDIGHTRHPALELPFL